MTREILFKFVLCIVLVFVIFVPCILCICTYLATLNFRSNSIVLSTLNPEFLFLPFSLSPSLFSLPPSLSLFSSSYICLPSLPLSFPSIFLLFLLFFPFSLPFLLFILPSPCCPSSPSLDFFTFHFPLLHRLLFPPFLSLLPSFLPFPPFLSLPRFYL